MDSLYAGDVLILVNFSSTAKLTSVAISVVYNKKNHVNTKTRHNYN